MHVGGVAKLWKSPNGRLKTVASPPPLYPICFSIHREGGSDFLEVPLNTSNSPCLKTILYLQLPLRGMSFHKKKKKKPLTSHFIHVSHKWVFSKLLFLIIIWKSPLPCHSLHCHILFLSAHHNGISSVSLSLCLYICLF